MIRLTFLQELVKAIFIGWIAFPHNYSDVFATSSLNDIRVWNAKNRQELLRIQVPNLECWAIAFMNDGKSIVSGWSDGKIRAFLPQSGRLLYVINDAYIHGCTSLTCASDCQRIISGGSEEVRVWEIGKQTYVMKFSMQEHRVRRIMSKELVLVQMGLVLFGILNHLPELCVYLKVLYSNWFCIILKRVNYQLLEVIEKLLIGKSLMDELQECQMDLKKVNLILQQLQKKESILYQEEKIRKLNYGDMMKESVILKVKDIQLLQQELLQVLIKTIISVRAEGAIFKLKMSESVKNSKTQQELPTVQSVKKQMNTQSLKSILNAKSVKSGTKSSKK
ncbi:unnamed protein product [Paramecium primaurelia]|uniref:Uncharacterized protein n=1 Tax=Paramecium primaurelia TaxID=5886 RepID=A0A8S1MFZ9_PARPR|nr:unnamed protein product [Paramecium primaurelia]